MATGDPAEEIRKLINDLGKIPPELRKALRPALKGAAEPIVADARGRASWSGRIPGAITLSVRLSKRNPGVSIRVRQTKAPHGRPWEGITGATSFKHPVFGHRDRWVTQATQPYLAPAAAAGTDDVLDAAAQTVDQVAREAGFR
ncbi:hypothetical protein FHR32_005130 [Streptosporangium album]|uniref:HK97 gp10 family phage protein n=1 Tax=Streptosporangium album TaxID=47479 RepID=A0A7W7WBD6_9ACTN|nr:HK97 gp10 family phage protein [Streptosporangium album]MBB4940753.1 hypothetical protein [Streptosporangium album]